MFGLGSLLAGASADMITAVALFRPTSFNGRTKRSTLNRDKGHSLASHGLNGKRAVARRLRQIEAGSLRVQNGLVA